MSGHFPVIQLMGLNAALVGARGLAEQVNIGLRSGATGLGLTAGLSMAFIAIMADRILRAWATKLGAE